MKNTLLQGQSNHGLYLIPSFSKFNKSQNPTALVGEHASVSSWHSRLGHLALSVVRRVLSSFKLPFLQNKKEPTSCVACLGFKSHQLPFSKSLHHSKFPLELMYTDV
jgi:hypothetical protein